MSLDSPKSLPEKNLTFSESSSISYKNDKEENS